MLTRQDKQQTDLIVVKVTENEKKLLAQMALGQNTRVEKFVYELIFSSGLIRNNFEKSGRMK